MTWLVWLVGVLACVVSCANAAMLYTEQGLEAADAVWDQHFYATLDECSSKHAAGTDGARACFGPTFEADRKVEHVVTSVVTLLRTYWIARAAGADPDWRETARRVAELVASLPPEARGVFDRVKGL